MSALFSFLTISAYSEYNKNEKQMQEERQMQDERQMCEMINLSFPLSYGNVFIPIQNMNEVFDPETGLAYGTIFPEMVDEYTKYLI